MSGKARSVYVCSECGYESPKWFGKCPGCGQWNTMNEEIREAKPKKYISSEQHYSTPPSRAIPITQINTSEDERYHTGMSELDRVLGGGIVKGSLILICGEPGIGKSTILLQICGFLGKGHKILYVSGEESAKQIKLRAVRLGVENDNIYILSETDIQAVIEQIREEKPDLVMVDSIQTMNFTDLSSAPGSVSQVRECTSAIMRAAKSLEIPVIIVGHVNKDGAIAGPKVLEHIVDTVLYFEGDRQLSYRILRAVKNRYGSTNEIGVFDMDENGLHQVENPSMALLSGRPKNVSGTCVTCMMEGSRPILAEIQGLATTTGFGTPRRMSTGFDYNRMSLLLAVLEKREGYYFSNLDAYVNVVGGLRLDEPAGDLAVALALVSSLKDKPINDKTIVFGEIGLAGELRSVAQTETRIGEASRLGFEKCIFPYNSLSRIHHHFDGIELINVKNVKQAFEAAVK